MNTMSISTCPIATVEAPVERVWQLLADPCNYGLWWDAETCSIEPAGPAKSGQRISARTRAQLPFGITVHNHIVCGALDNEHCRVSFG
jgi:hypothetical protein